MMNKKIKPIIYYTSTILLTLLMLFSAGMYCFNYEMVTGFFENLGYPIYIIYPLAAAKILGLITIWTKFSKSLTEWAYAGFFFDVLLAFFAHIMINDGGHLVALIGVFLVLISYFTRKT